MNHRHEDKAQRVTTQFDGIAIFHLYGIVGNTIEALHHLERLFIADNLNVGKVLLNKCNGTAVVGLHVVDDKVVNLAVTNDLLDMFQELREEVNLHRINEAHLLVINEIRVVTNTIRQWPQALKEVLVAVVHAYIKDFVCNF